MKLTGITGTGTGKLGSSIFAVNAGTQIVRQYQPVVANPSTEAQIEQRAKLKLASQLARDMKGAIAIPKDGIVSARNRFMSKNFGAITYSDGTAEATLADIQLTLGSLYMPAMTAATFSTGVASLTMSFAENVPEYEHFVLNLFVRNADGSLSLKASIDKAATDIVITNAMVAFTTGDVQPADGDVVFIYGYNFTSESARASYGDLTVNNQKTIASLVATSSLLANNVEFSRTVEGVAALAA